MISTINSFSWPSLYIYINIEPMQKMYNRDAEISIFWIIIMTIKIMSQDVSCPMSGWKDKKRWTSIIKNLFFSTSNTLCHKLLLHHHQKSCLEVSFSSSSSCPWRSHSSCIHVHVQRVPFIRILLPGTYFNFRFFHPSSSCSMFLLLYRIYIWKGISFLWLLFCPSFGRWMEWRQEVDHISGSHFFEWETHKSVPKVVPHLLSVLKMDEKCSSKLQKVHFMNIFNFKDRKSVENTWKRRRNVEKSCKNSASKNIYFFHTFQYTKRRIQDIVWITNFLPSLTISITASICVSWRE